MADIKYLETPPQQINIAYTKEIREDEIPGIITAIRHRLFCLKFTVQKHEKWSVLNHNFVCFFFA